MYRVYCKLCDSLLYVADVEHYYCFSCKKRISEPSVYNIVADHIHAMKKIREEE
jgi:hypothetical protein